MNAQSSYWDGPAFTAGRDVPCQSCDATGVCGDGEQIDVDHFRACLCDHCAGTGIEPWRPAGGRDTSGPHFDSLGNGDLRGWRERLARDKRDDRSTDFQLAWVRGAHWKALRILIGQPVLIELDVAESFAAARASMTANRAKPRGQGAFASRLFPGKAT